MNNTLQPQDRDAATYIIDTPFWEDAILADDVQPETIVVDAWPPAYPGISVREFMQRTTVYENLPAPFAVKLRRGALAGMALTVAGALSLALLPVLNAVLVSAPILVLHPFLNAYINWLANSPLPRAIDGALLTSSLVLLIVTRGLRHGGPSLHWLALVEALGGSANLLMLAIPLIVICLNIALWLLIAIVILVFVVLLFALLIAIL